MMRKGWWLVAPAAIGFDLLLIRRPFDAPDDPKKLAYYLTFALVGTLLETLAAVAGRRWTIEESFEVAYCSIPKNWYRLCGLVGPGGTLCPNYLLRAHRLMRPKNATCATWRAVIMPPPIGSSMPG